MSDWEPTYCEEVVQVREQTFRDEEELTMSLEEIDELIDVYGFHLPEEDPLGGGFLCDYFPEMETDRKLRDRILYNQYRIYEVLLGRYKDSEEHRVRLRRIK